MIYLIDQNDGKTASDVPAAKLRAMFPGSRQIITTDFEVSGEEGLPLETPDGQMVGYRYQSGGNSEILSIDHHGPDPRMMRRVSSTNLALHFIRVWGTVNAAVVTHTDYDSAVTAGMLTGRLPLKLGEILGAAAIAADHTGEENVFADTLQAIQDLRDVEFSLSCLRTLLQQGEDYLPPVAREALQGRREQRAKLMELILAGVFKNRRSGVYVAFLNTRVDGELLPSLLPQATVIVTVSPPQKEGDGYLVKTRLGMAAPEGMSLKAFNLPGWGGRWNAGSTGRHGGTANPETFIAAVCDAVENYKQ